MLMPTHPEAPAAERAPRVPVTASSVSNHPSECPNGASSFSPGLARQRRDYPGLNEQKSHNPEGVVSFPAQPNTTTTPLGLLNHFDPVTQGRPQARPTLGWRTESRWDSFWTAPAEPSGDGAFARTTRTRTSGNHRPLEQRGRASLAPAVQDTLNSRHDSPI